MDYLIDALLILGKAHLLILLIVISVWIIEITLGLNLLVKMYIWKKNPKLAMSTTDLDSLVYVLLNIGAYLYYQIHGEPHFHWLTFLIWFGSLVLLSYLFRKIHYRFQGIDPDKAEDDYT